MSRDDEAARGGWPFLGGTVALGAVLAMGVISAQAWPVLAGGMVTTSRDGRTLTTPGWLTATVMPVATVLAAGAMFFAQPVRRRMARALRVPLWRTDSANKRQSNLGLVLISIVFMGLHIMILGFAGALRPSAGLSVLGICLGVMLIVLGNSMGKLDPLTEEQREFFPAGSRGFVDGYRDGVRRAFAWLRWPFIGAGAVACLLACVVPWAAFGVLLLAALSMLVPLTRGLLNGLAHHDDAR